MIKYKVQLKDSLSTRRAREKRDQLFKPLLKGMHCKKCIGIDSYVVFQLGEYNMVYPTFECCCPDFEKRIREKLGMEA